MRFLRAISMMILATVVLTGCKKDNDQELRDQEMRRLQQYLVDNNITTEPTASGLYYIETKAGTGNKSIYTDAVDFEYTRKLLDGTVLLTSDEQLARDNGLYDEQRIYGPVRAQVGATGVPGLDEGFQLMRTGGEATMIMPSDINGFGSNANGPPYTTHIYDVKLIHSFNNPPAFQDSMINVYLEENEITDYYKTENGLYYIENVAGEGEYIKDGDAVKLWYTGTFLDGRQFDSNVGDVIMRLVMPATGYIPAWDEALRLMQNGTEARIIVPYQLGYGAYSQGQIPPFKTLVFDMSIVDVL